MHNLHLVVVQAETAKEGCSAAESELEEFGNENNWYVASGCVSEDDEVYRAGMGRFAPDDSVNIEGINKMVTEWMSGDDMYSEQGLKNLKTYAETGKLDKAFDWYFIIEFAETQKAKAELEERLKGKPFNVLTDEFRDYEYTECGVTQYQMGDDKTDKVYVVFIDMHS